MKRSSKAQAGFTLIELLVVVLIIGILASIAIPQYFKVVERARLAEAQAFISEVKQAQERYLARNGSYAQTNNDLSNLDVSFPGATPFYGMKYFSVAMGAGNSAGCNPGDPYYNIALTRQVANAGVAPRYTSTYQIIFERCAGTLQYPNCANCTSDFSQ